MKNPIDLEQQHVAALAAGSYDAFTFLYDRYAKHLYGFVFNLTKVEALTEDIVQDTFVALWTNRGSIDINKSFKSYLYAIAYNQVINQFRKQVNRPEMVDFLDYANDPKDNSANAEQLFDFEVFCNELEKGKQKLTKSQRLIFVLCKEDGKKVSEVASLLEITEQSVRNQLSTAMGILRKELSKFGCLFMFMFYDM